MGKVYEHLLGELLFYANSAPPAPWRELFYSLKDRVLVNYGEFQDSHLQHIVKECYNCTGGKVYERHAHLGEIVPIYAGPCRQCNGTGVHREFWTVLALFRVGKRTFHMPIKRFESYQKSLIPDLPFAENIEGYIHHERPKYYLNVEAFFWLLLLFEPKTFFSKMGKIGCASRKFTPMVILSTMLFDGLDIGHKAYRWKRNFTLWKQAHCFHDYPDGSADCSWCGWSEFPF